MTNALPANGTPLQVGAEKSQENARLLFIDLSWILIRLQRLHWLATCLYGLPSCVSTLFPHLALPLCIQLKFWLCVQIAMTHYQTQVGVIVHETHAHTSKPAHCPKTFMRTATDKSFYTLHAALYICQCYMVQISFLASEEGTAFPGQQALRDCVFVGVGNGERGFERICVQQSGLESFFRMVMS